MESVLKVIPALRPFYPQYDVETQKEVCRPGSTAAENVTQSVPALAPETQSTANSELVESDNDSQDDDVQVRRAAVGC